MTEVCGAVGKEGRFIELILVAKRCGKSPMPKDLSSGSPPFVRFLTGWLLMPWEISITLVTLPHGSIRSALIEYRPCC